MQVVSASLMGLRGANSSGVEVSAANMMRCKAIALVMRQSVPMFYDVISSPSKFYRHVAAPFPNSLVSRQCSYILPRDPQTLMQKPTLSFLRPFQKNHSAPDSKSLQNFIIRIRWGSRPHASPEISRKS